MTWINGLTAGAARGAAHAFVNLLPPLSVVAVLIVVWEVGVKALHVKQYLLPPPSKIWIYLLTDYDLLWRGSVVTSTEIVIGFLISVALGMPLGILVARYRIFSLTMYPLIVASQTFPKLAIGPLLIVWFGFGQLPKLLLAILVSFFPIMINTIAGLNAVDDQTEMLARSLGLGRFQTFFKIQLPQALPFIFAGLKVGITLAVIGVIVGEFLGTSAGLGFLIINATGTVDTVALFGVLVVLTVIGLVSYGIVAGLERVAIPWHYERRDVNIPAG
ncbi:MAG: ABC transporter permease [Candidatus Dormibacteraeota bacterium]|uniref:ABC transporter permease n=1 Tax=Candidatus Dormiibacter inghamiae TaxID=3127013 RepID=A0A934KDQ7_9BACT|nr:ABC transporter permease [Candidatus Dormibacteraeota bacterium]